MSQCAHSRTPTPSSEKPHVASRETPRKDGTTQRKMHHQNECREKWENGEGIQIKLSCSIDQEGGEKFAVTWPQYILWSLVPQGLSSALLQCHQSVKTLNSLQAHK